MSKVPAKLKYTKTHEWVKQEDDGTILLGVTDHAQQLLGDLVKIMATVIAYQFIAKKMFVHFIVTELFLMVITYFTSIYFIDMYGNNKNKNI